MSWNDTSLVLGVPVSLRPPPEPNGERATSPWPLSVLACAQLGVRFLAVMPEGALVTTAGAVQLPGAHDKAVVNVTSWPSGPYIAFSTSAQSSTDRQIGPSLSIDQAMAIAPCVLTATTRPRISRRP